MDHHKLNTRNGIVKVVYCLRTAGHFPYHVSTLNALVERGAKVQIVLDEAWSKNRTTIHIEEWTKRYGQPGFLWMPVWRGFLKRDFIFGIRELRTYASYLRRKGQSDFFRRRWLNCLPNVARRILKLPVIGSTIEKILRHPHSDWVFKSIESFYPIPHSILKFVKELNPDVLVASPTNLRYSSETDHIKAAKELGVRTVIPVLSWDNLTTKGLLHIVPDRVLAWNDAHREEAEAIHGIPIKNVAVTGSPFFDKWFGRHDPPRLSREQFCRRVGLDPEKPFVLYLGSTEAIAADESWIISELRDSLRIQSENELSALQVLIRPHPSHHQIFNKVLSPHVAIWPKDNGPLGLAVPEQEDELEDFELSVRYSIGVLGLNTSAMIDALAIGKPVISFLARDYQQTMVEAQHFQHLLNSQALIIAHTIPEIVDCVRKVDLLWAQNRAASECFVRSFLRPPGGEYMTAGNAQAEAILNLVGPSYEIQNAGSKSEPKVARRMADERVID